MAAPQGESGEEEDEEVTVAPRKRRGLAKPPPPVQVEPDTALEPLDPPVVEVSPVAEVSPSSPEDLATAEEARGWLALQAEWLAGQARAETQVMPARSSPTHPGSHGAPNPAWSCRCC